MYAKTLACLLAGCAFAGTAAAQGSDGVVRLGVLNDQSGPFADSSGTGSVLAARMAVQDFGGAVLGVPVEVVAADHQNKPDIASNRARGWFDRNGVDAVLDLGNSAVALAVNEIARGQGKVVLVSAAGTTALTGKACSPTTIHWTYDNWALANAAGSSITRSGGADWFFVTADYAFGADLQANAEKAVTKAGGKVLGGVRHPLNTADFSSLLLQAQASGAKIVALANAGEDTANSIKQAQEFGLDAAGQRLVALSGTISDVHALGLAAAQGLLVAEPFYWDKDEGTRAWSARFAALNRGRQPTMIQAGVYSSVLHYLKAVRKAGTDDGRTVAATMKELPTDDPLFGRGTVRADGRKIHPLHLWQVKAPGESRHPWDYYTLVDTIPGEQAFRPLSESECPLVR